QDAIFSVLSTLGNNFVRLQTPALEEEKIHSTPCMEGIKAVPRSV
ncbi:MAG: hypothetical protein ACI8Z0_000921, partial [Lentimonas sp.]